MRYQYSSQGFKQRFNSNPLSLPNGVKTLLIINIIVFILIEISGQRNILFQLFGLVPRSVIYEYKIWQICTYLFIHGGLLHIIFNMLVLWIVGKDLELEWGKNNFLTFYFICGVGAGLVTVIINTQSFIPVVGASGAIYGVLVAYGFTYPNRIVYLYGLFPLQVKYLVLGLGLIAFFASLSTSTSNISHITHLSGMLIGITYIFLKYKWKYIYLWYIKMRIKTIQHKPKNNEDEISTIKIQMDNILDKLNEDGWDSLTQHEEEFLTKSSKRLFNQKPPD